MARRPFVCGNWKMYTNAHSGKALAVAIATAVTDDRVRVAICPPYPYLALIAEVIAHSRVELGAQNLYPAKEGAFTGEVSPGMLVDVGCRYVILGHSERRHVIGEKPEFIDQKVLAAFAAGLNVILCIGETLAEREANHTERVIKDQLLDALQGCDPTHIDKLVIAYEPVWAIGTGQNATPEQAQEIHGFIRGLFADRVGRDAADRLVIQYGGSVKPENAAAIMAQPDVDGALVGGASLKAASFLAIVAAARS
jgi:triosephosphate isomerase (TIM)